MRSEPKFVLINKVKYTKYHLVVFLLTYYCYALFHANRKILSNVKTTISDEWLGSCDIKNNQSSCHMLKPDTLWNQHHMFQDHAGAKMFLGELDAIFLAAYSVGMFISGVLGDRFNLRLVLFGGIMVTSLSMFCFGVLSEWFHIYSKIWYIVFYSINGLAQSTGWPTIIAIMSNWFGKSSRGLIFGVWSSCISIGNIIGALMVSHSLKYGYQYSFIIPSYSFLSVGILVYFGIIISPKEIGLNYSDKGKPVFLPIHTTSSCASTNEILTNERNELSEPLKPATVLKKKEKKKAISFWKAFLLPGVIMYSLCFACLKMINYSFLFWLPFYLTSKFGWRETVAGEISIWYDVGGIFGGIIGGFLSDLVKKRSVVIVVLLTLAIPSLFLFSQSTSSKISNASLICVTGFFIGGTSKIISSTITADIGQQGQIKGNKEALSTVTGIVDGTGSIGAALGQIFVPLIQEYYDWHYVFYFFILLCFMTNMFIFPLFIRDCKALHLIRLAKSEARCNKTQKLDQNDELKEVEVEKF